ncbi:hypothetical protein EXT68_21195 [Pectobacterium parmentieri]|uniref:hypothetical protein n=1 Tax=Pectobacterium TaxID=122277 RepID=UPI0004740FCB|nr:MULTISPECIES: hypothetical protein [Pectobacterium]MBI0473503.1 hypothetical protein [Pectobacterium parmentieri]MBI0496124.1 hypothetical protein [Pectobacterium parmentieri]MBI0570652.1 hypothetical protein [Pectobacterium parmentieri]MBI0575351.1 hypothetical protein [Pectobacterium parmentieri]MCL6357944.1 hypothetical protein [Pectobacterium parmentieri]
MATKKKKRKPRTPGNNNSITKTKWSHLRKINKFILWLAAIGILPIATNYTFDFFTGDVQVKYIQSLERGYEFKLINNSSTDQVIEQFRISPEFGQRFIFKINKPVYGIFSENGVTLPGGNSTYMPAFEYKEMNGYVLGAKSEVSFRIPPLAARDYMIPDAIIVYADYKTSSKNKIMRNIEKFLGFLNIIDINKRQKYMVVDNYWTPLAQGNEVNAIKNACRDDDIFSKSETCKEQFYE